MNQEIANIFIDEFGNTALNVNKQGTFSHFIYCSIIINEKDKEKAELLRKKIIKDNKLGEDIKSNRIGEKYFNRRLKILKELTEGLDFTIDLLVIDKSKLYKSEGLIQKQIFYKYFQNLFVKKYNDRYESFTIWADKVGEAFRFELQDYIRNKSISPSLFHQNRFFYLSDDISEEKLIQFADIISGSLGKVFCASHTHKRAQEIYDILHSRLSVEFFPYLSSSTDININENSKYDKEIVEINLKIAADQLEILRQKDKSEEVLLLKYLILSFRIDSMRLVPTYEITTYLSQFFNTMSDERVRTLVRNLRYDGVFLISHPGKPGYKLASSYYDITQQFQHYLRYVIPMLQKVKILNSSLANQTFNAINILESDNTFKELKQMLTGIK